MEHYEIVTLVTVSVAAPVGDAFPFPTLHPIFTWQTLGIIFQNLLKLHSSIEPFLTLPGKTSLLHPCSQPCTLQTFSIATISFHIYFTFILVLCYGLNRVPQKRYTKVLNPRM